MANTTTYTTYSEARGAQHGELWHLLIRNEDRIPRNLIDECARRGDDFVDHAAALLDKDYYWGEDVSSGEWWLPIHAAMILGLVPTARAGEVLARYVRRIHHDEYDDRQDWLSGYWGALFRNKPDSAMPMLQAMAEDRTQSWYARIEAAEAVIAHAHARGERAARRSACMGSECGFQRR